MTPFASTPEQALAEGFAHHVVHWARERSAPATSLEALRAAAAAVSLATASGHVCALLADIAAAEPGRDLSAWRQALLDSGMVGTSADIAAAHERAGPSPARIAPSGRDGAQRQGCPDERAGPSPARIAPSGRDGAQRQGCPDERAYPLVLDDDGRLYLHRYFDYETRLARSLAAAAAPAPHGADGETIALLDRLFAANRARLGDRPDWQKLATALALERRLCVVSGGPGTGKTTTVVNLLACVLARDPECRIALAAPTGKAAARMLEAIRGNAARLPDALRERLPAASSTVHRLLGVSADTGRFRFHAGNRLPIDLIVVDEASMLDLALATHLVEALPPAARIVLLGDKDQLAAVEAGAVFAELCADPAMSPECRARLSALTGIPVAGIAGAAGAEANGLHDSVVWLTESFRFAADSGIGRLAALVNGGDAPGAIECLRGEDPSLEWIDAAPMATDAAVRQRIVEGLAPYLAAARAPRIDKAAMFAALAAFRVLCAEREGARGVQAINEFAGRHFRQALDHPLDAGTRSPWYPGRPVMVLRNDYVQNLYNGDVGIALPDDEDALMVWFPASDGGFRAVSPLRLPEHETAFATTVHKAQGSEFEHVLLLLPTHASRVATRELVYTAITRARRGVAIAGSEEAITSAILTPTRRHSGLLARLAEARGKA